MNTRKKTNDIKVSVIIPVYNAEAYLEECLSSVSRQTLRDIEIICIDDESTDGSRQILNRYAGNDKRFVILDQPHSNAGVARNKGLEVARGEYLAFLDADDYFEQDALEKVYLNTKKDPETDIVIFEANYNHEKKQTLSYSELGIMKKYCPDEEIVTPQQISKYIFNAFQNWVWNKVFRTSFIKEQNICFQDVARSNDALFVCCALSTARKIILLREPLITHRVGQQTNMQANNTREPDAFMQAYEAIYEKLIEIHGEDFGIYRQSFLNKTMLSFRSYVLTVKKDKIIYEYLKHLVVYKGEKLFHLLEQGEDYYYMHDVYLWYKEVYDEIIHGPKTDDKTPAKKEKKSWIPKKIRRIIKSIRQNGMSYTLKRILFHLHLMKDNDPDRTNRKK